jgi:hypothetical protein
MQSDKPSGVNSVRDMSTNSYDYGMWVVVAFNVGLFLLIAGFLVQWPTLITVLMAPVLASAYRRLARQEERSMRERFGNAYERYAARLPGFFPPPIQWRAFLTTSVPEGREAGGAQWKDS